jgi:CHRD domain
MPGPPQRFTAPVSPDQVEATPRVIREAVMTMKSASALIPVILLPIALVVACSDDENNGPQPTVFNVPLTTAAETPMCPDAGVNAVGNATVTIPADNSSVMVNVSYAGLSGAVTAGHIHFGGPNAPGPVVLPFGPPLDSPFSKTLTSADYAPGTGTPADFPSFVTALRTGDGGYLNLHTGPCPPGEIRGQIR